MRVTADGEALLPFLKGGREGFSVAAWQLTRQHRRHGIPAQNGWRTCPLARAFRSLISAFRRATIALHLLATTLIAILTAGAIR